MFSSIHSNMKEENGFDDMRVNESMLMISVPRSPRVAPPRVHHRLESVPPSW